MQEHSCVVSYLFGLKTIKGKTSCECGKSLNKQIFETIYYAAMRASCDLAKEQGHYASYKGSPISRGKFQFDLWGTIPSDRWDWKKLREDIAKWGVRNSLTTCIISYF